MKIAMIPSSQRHPMVSPTKPPTIGPNVGPVKGAAVKSNNAGPLSDAGNRSAMTPPELVSAEEPKAPAKKRRMRRVSLF